MLWLASVQTEARLWLVLVHIQDVSVHKLGCLLTTSFVLLRKKRKEKRNKMPLIVKDYVWEETEKTVFITVPLKGVKANKVDILSSEEYLKVSCC